MTILRNHVLSERIPTTDGYLMWSGERAKLKSGIALDRSELLRARNWSKKARRYLETAGSSILIHEVVGEYRDLVIDFYQWLDAAIRRRNEQALAELDARSAEVAAALEEAWGPVVPDPARAPTDPASH